MFSAAHRFGRVEFLILILTTKPACLRKTATNIQYSKLDMSKPMSYQGQNVFLSFGRIEGMKYWFLNFPILKVQKMDMEKREKAAKERNANIERSKEELVAKVTGTKRKSKWDQAGPLGAPQPPITSIPAFGALSKK